MSGQSKSIKDDESLKTDSSLSGKSESNRSDEDPRQMSSSFTINKRQITIGNEQLDQRRVTLQRKFGQTTVKESTSNLSPVITTRKSQDIVKRRTIISLQSLDISSSNSTERERTLVSVSENSVPSSLIDSDDSADQISHKRRIVRTFIGKEGA